METQSVVSRRVMAIYGVGQLGAQVFRDTPAFLLPIFMITVLGVPAWLSGLPILLPKLWLIVCDPTVGALSDRAKARWGRTPFLAAGATLTSLGFGALFLVTDYPTPYLAAAATFVIFLLSSTGFSLFSVPYLAVASELSRDPHDRTRIMVYRMGFSITGVLVGVGFAQPLVAHFGGGPYGWHIMAATLAVICFVSMISTAIGLRRVRLIPGVSERQAYRRQLSSVLTNRPYVILLATCFIQNIGQACSYTVIGFIFLYAVGAIGLIPLFVLTMACGSLAAQPLWLTLSRRFGKERCYVLATLGWMLITITWFFLRRGDDMLVTLPIYGALSTQGALVLLRAVIIGVVNSGFVLLSLSMLTDTVDLERRRTGVAHEGVFAGVFSAGEKLAFAVGPVIAGGVLSIFGFASSQGGAVSQTPHAITGVLLLFSLIPAVFQVVALLVFSRYRLATTRRLEVSTAAA